jgi:hypothetical protein
MFDWLTRFLSALPENANLRIKLADSSEALAQSKAEIASLKDDLRHAQAKIKQQGEQIQLLRKTNDELRHDKYSLKQPQIEILKLTAHKIYPKPLVTVFTVQKDLALHQDAAQYHLERLVEVGFLKILQMPPAPPTYHLTHAGREYLVSNDLLPE